MSRETILIIALIVSLLLVFYTIPKINKLNISKSKKSTLYYLTIGIPVLGFIVTKILEGKEANN